MAGWPDATNTGVPDGVTLLPSGDIVVTKAGTVISGLDIKGTVYINADNVTLQNCKVTSANYWVVKVQDGVEGATVQDSTLNGVGTGNDGNHGIMGTGTFLRNDIYNVENGITLTGSAHIEGNYIHDLKSSGSPHYDGIQIDGGVSDVVIRGNTIINDYGQTAAIMIDNWFGPISNIKVDGNLLVGGGYTVYSDGQFDGGSITGVSFTNNHMGAGQYGISSFVGNNPVFTGNVMDGHALADTLGSQSGDSGPVVTPPPTLPPTSTTATDGADHLNGTTANNVIDGKGGNDVINAAAGNDTIFGGAGYDTLTGGAGNDIFAFRSAAEIGTGPINQDVITDFVQGQDKIDLSAIDANANLTGNQDFTFVAANDGSFTETAGEIAWRTDGAGHTIVQGDVNGDGKHDFELVLNGAVSLKASDFIGVGAATAKPPVDGGSTVTPVPPVVDSTLKTLSGTTSADRITGTSANELLDGNAGNDILNSAGGNDKIYGGAGRDTMTGGTGDDIFLFKAVSDMGKTVASRDVITDFTHGQDKIDLSALDANSKIAGSQAFSFLATDDQSFTHKAGEVAWHTQSGRTVVQGDTNGDGIHDFEIQLTGTVHLGAGDFIL